MKRIWRCRNCPGETRGKRFEFIAEAGPHEKGVCPKCGAGGDVRTAAAIVMLKVIHLEPMSDIRGIGTGVLACTGAAPKPGQMHSGDPAAVNCPRCKDADAFKVAMGERVKHPGYDLEDDEPTTLAAATEDEYDGS